MPQWDCNSMEWDCHSMKALPVGQPFYGGAPSGTVILWRRSQWDCHSMDALPVGLPFYGGAPSGTAILWRPPEVLENDLPSLLQG